MDISEWSLAIDKCILEGDNFAACICVWQTLTLKGNHYPSPMDLVGTQTPRTKFAAST